jgi:hypothetical protein
MHYYPVEINTKNFEILNDFADEFDHKIANNRKFYKTVAHSCDGQLIGFCDYILTEICFPAFHPKYTKPHHVLKVMNDWRARCEIEDINAFVGVDFETDHNRRNFPESILNKLGLQRVKKELYCPINFKL